MAELTEKDIEMLRASGVTVESNNPQLSIAGMTQMLGQMQAIVDSNNRIAAKNNSDLVQAVMALNKTVQSKTFKAQDLKPLVDVIVELNQPVPSQPTPTYNFTITRNSRGLMTGVTATPLKED